jgi:predicted amidohydrolase
VKIAVTHFNIEWEEKEINFEKCHSIVETYSRAKIDLVIFPEMTLTGFTMDTAYSAEDFNTSETVRKFCKLAKDNEIAILFGVALKYENQVTNNAVLVSKVGDIIQTYSKIHLFSISDENRNYHSGTELKTVEFLNLTIGFSICYDLRFPELFRAYADNCDLVINIANWPKSRIKNWSLLLRARALENQMYMVGVNRIGSDQNSLEYIRSSAVIDPNGEFLEPELDVAEVSIYNIEKEVLRKTRINFPVLNDRRMSLYKQWSEARTEGI